MNLRQSLDAEQAVVGSILIDPRSLPEAAAILRPEDFGMAADQAVFRAALALDAQGRAVDPVTIQQETQRAGEAVPAEYLLQLMDATPTAANVKEYAELTRQSSLRREIDRICESARQSAEGGEDPGDVLAQLLTQLTALEQDGTSKTLLSPMDLALRWADHRMALESGKSGAFVKTGYRDLDIILGGGLLAGGMHVLAARPGMGKTTLALNIADRVAARGQPVLFVSLEMDDEQITAKRIAQDSGVPGNRLLMDPSLREEETEKMAASADKLLMRQLYLNARPSATVADIAALARKVRGLRLIVIDYMGKIAANKQNGRASLYEITTQNSADVKTLARTFKVPVLVLCQINRESEKRSDKRPGLADLRDTGAIEQDADTVTFLYRKEYYGDPTTRDPYMPEETECLIEKNRHGATGKCKLAFYAATSKFVTANADPRAGYRTALEAGAV